MITAATGLAILHVLDDAFIGKQRGSTAGGHLLAAGVLLVVLGGSLALGVQLWNCRTASTPARSTRTR